MHIYITPTLTGSWGPIFVRLAWHASGTYNQFDNNGGSNGATMRFSPEKDWDANAGLGLARDRLESVKKQFPGECRTCAGGREEELLMENRLEARPRRRNHSL